MKLDYIDHKKSKTSVEATLVVKNCRVSVLDRGLLRVEYSERGFLDDPTIHVWAREARFFDFSFKRNGEFVRIVMPDKRVAINTEDFSKSYLTYAGSKKRVKLNNDKSLKGATRTLDMSPEDMIHYDDPVTERRVDIYYKDESIYENGVTSRNGVAVYDDAGSPVAAFDGEVLPNPLEHDYYVFIHKNDYFGALDDLYALSGGVPMLPRYVFGNWWSRYWSYTDEEYLDLLDRFEEKNVPLSVATIDMGWHYVDIEDEFGLKKRGLTDESKYGETHGWTGWTWNKHLFPDYRAFLKNIKDRDMRITVNLHPSSGIRWFEDYYEKACKALGKDASVKTVIPFDFTDNRFIDVYFAMLGEYEKGGVDFWWIDWQQGNSSKIKGYDPLWGLNHHHYYKKREAGERGLILSRYSGFGSHRYPLGFSGDTTQKWNILEFVVKFTVASTNSGYTFWSHDIAGHHSGYKDNELYIRWLQFALFNPINRLHSTSGQLYGKEPWNYDKEVELSAIDLLQRRQKFIPYLYTVASDNYFENKPFITPVYYLYPEDDRAYKCDGQYFLGDLLVCPIVKRTEQRSKYAKTKVFFPKGEWTDIYTHTRYAGDSERFVCRKSGYMPVFAKNGTIIYRNHDLVKADGKATNFDLKVFAGNGETKIYEDDGVSLDYEKGGFFITRISQKIAGGKLTITFNFEGDASLVPENRSYYIELPNIRLKKAEAAGLDIRAASEGDCPRVVIKNAKTGKDFSIVIGYEDIPAREYVLGQIKRVMLPYNGNNQADNDFYDEICRAPSDRIKDIIAKSEHPKNLKTRLFEIVDDAF